MADLITLEQLKDYLGIGAKAVSNKDGELSAAISAASDFVRDQLNMNLDLRSYTEVLDGNGRPFLPLKEIPVATSPLPTVTENGVSLVVAFGYDLDADVIVDPVRGFINRQTGTTAVVGVSSPVPGTWAPGFQNVTVGYDAGVAVASLDNKYQLLTKYVAGRYFKETDEKRIGKTRSSQGQHQVDFAQDLPPFYQEIIRSNKRVYFAR